MLLNFWAHWCVPCEAEAPLLEHTQHELAAGGGTVLGVTYKDIGEQSEQFVQRFHLTYPNARDGSGEFAAAYGTDRIPESFLIDPQGRIVAISRGEIEPAFADAGARTGRAMIRRLVAATAAAARARGDARLRRRVAARDRTPGDVRDLQNPADGRRVPAGRQRAGIHPGLIAKGESEEQIKQRLLAQYGPAVLALPQTSGFDLTAYLVPVVVVLGGVILLIVLIPRWRRRAPGARDRRGAQRRAARPDRRRHGAGRQLARYICRGAAIPSIHRQRSSRRIVASDSEIRSARVGCGLGVDDAAVPVEGGERLGQLQRVGRDRWTARRSIASREFSREREQRHHQQALGRVQRLARRPTPAARWRREPSSSPIRSSSEAIRACAYWT